ncbi:TPA: LysR family transcriptional regulator, partial [Burkholderia multivorans]|nr:LysR family transcriptional regulator [Burkholderia multivorans]
PQDEVVYAVYPRSPFTSNKLKQFIEHARIALLDPPWGRRDDNDAPANIAPVDMV